MSTKTETNKFKSADAKTTSLICGYIRCMKISSNRIIPWSIIQLLIQFYLSKLKIICLKQNHRQFADVNIAVLDENKYYKCNIKSLLKSDNAPKHHNVNWNSALCYVKDFELPTSLISVYDELYDNHQYDIIFLIGGSGSKQCNAYIVDINYNFNIFHWRLPSFSSSITGSQPYALYSNKHGLITVGNNGNKSFNILPFDNKYIDENNNQYEWKWDGMQMNKSRHNPSAVMISDDLLFCCGGYGYPKLVDYVQQQKADVIQEYVQIILIQNMNVFMLVVVLMLNINLNILILIKINGIHYQIQLVNIVIIQLYGLKIKI